jgi:sulfur carrier protein
LIAVTVNGDPYNLEATATVDTIIELLGCGRRGVAVAINSEIVARSAWGTTAVAAGDHVEVLRAVQGG